MVAVPSATAVTSPFLETAATAVLVEDQVTSTAPVVPLE